MSITQISVADPFQFLRIGIQIWAWKLNTDLDTDSDPVPDPNPSQYYVEHKFICPYR